jgi:hypothetical protein
MGEREWGRSQTGEGGEWGEELKRRERESEACVIVWCVCWRREKHGCAARIVCAVQTQMQIALILTLVCGLTTT